MSTSPVHPASPIDGRVPIDAPSVAKKADAPAALTPELPPSDPTPDLSVPPSSARGTVGLLAVGLFAAAGKSVALIAAVVAGSTEI
jgi:hypothetical protein